MLVGLFFSHKFSEVELLGRVVLLVLLLFICTLEAWHMKFMRGSSPQAWPVIRAIFPSCLQLALPRCHQPSIPHSPSDDCCLTARGRDQEVSCSQPLAARPPPPPAAVGGHEVIGACQPGKGTKR
uniref:Uncharacterized protein n=1 Tax=Pipistrellus kuhlii TaxID=59472 RepID=A0A7J7VV26_PIPKU|nr:hypothetical protein mPipKuh1_008278 [Pipistrellus kuhlii]